MTEFTPYQVQPHLRKRFDAIGRALAFSAESVGDWEHWRRQLSARLRELTGYDTMIPVPHGAQITEVREFDGYIRQRIQIHTEPDVIMTLYVLIPSAQNGPFPAVLTPHGHSSGGKYAVVNERVDDGIAKTIEDHNYDYGVQFVKAGFIVFAPDARGFGERQEGYAKGNLQASSCQWINNMAIPLGQTVTGMWAWDLHRLIDYAQSRDDVLSDRIGCAGLSGGGLQTLWASALDERIRCAVVSGYLYGYRESLLDLHGNCSCNYVPHLYEYADMGDIAALIAPRPLLVETGDKDPLNGASGLDNVYPQVDTARAAYRLLGAEDNLYHDVFDGPHTWHGVHAIPWMQTHLMG